MRWLTVAAWRNASRPEVAESWPSFGKALYEALRHCREVGGRARAEVVDGRTLRTRVSVENIGGKVLWRCTR